MPSYCFLNAVSILVDQTSEVVHLGTWAGEICFQSRTRNAAGAIIVTPPDIVVSADVYPFLRVVWTNATAILDVQGSITQRVDEWGSLGNVYIPIGAATTISVYMG